MPEILKTEIGFTNLANFIENKIELVKNIERQLCENTEIVEVSIESIVKSLGEVENEIESNHRTAIKAWRQSHKIYADFIKKNPGSTMIQRPQEMPKKPAQLQDIKGNIRMFKTYVQKAIKIKVSFLREIFNTSSQALSTSYSTRDYWVGASTGSMMTANYCLSGPSTTTNSILSNLTTI